jgi:hypothetical protein
MSEDDTIGSIEGTATFKEVKVWPDGYQVKVEGKYVDGSITTYEVPRDAVYIGGLNLDEVGGEIRLTMKKDEWVLVEATEDSLYITSGQR